MSGQVNENEWYATWFDSPYYPVLYGHRDETDAQHFLDELTKLDIFKPGIKIADICCGRGRHASYLHAKGFVVFGFDLSQESISHCQKLAKPGISFFRHDMRDPFPEAGFDVVLNLFTSFGYFDTVEQNTSALSHMCAAMKPSGYLVIDFLNINTVLNQLVVSESVVKEGIRFELSRKVENGRIEKTIHIDDHGKNHVFKESVAMLDLDAFKSMLLNCGMEIVEVFGNYDLHDYNPMLSPRLIIVAKHAQP